MRQEHIYALGALHLDEGSHDTSEMGANNRKKTHIRAWRKAAGMTQEQLAAASGLSQETISRLESGKIAYTQDSLEALAAALRCNVDDLVGRRPSENDEVRALLESFSDSGRRRALAVLRALKDEPA